MNKRFLLSVFMLIMLISFVARPQVVFADDGTNPPPDATETTPPESTDTSQASPTEAVETPQPETDPTTAPEAEATKVPETETPLSTETPTVKGTTEEFPVATETILETAPEEETPESVDVPEVLSQAPEGTDLVVLDENGEAEPLASQEAADILVNGDPMWCPGSTLPGGAGCSISYNTFDDLLNDASTFSGNGTIYVAYNYNSAVEPYDVEINGTLFTNPGSITIQGGWDFGSNTLYASNPYSAFNTLSLSILNWSSVSVNNVTINGSAYGLEISNTGDVSISDVTVANTTGNNGITVDSTGNVDLTNVDVSNSAGSDGIGITTNGDVNLTNVTSSSNGYSGATITGNNVNVQGSTFNGNGDFDNITSQINGDGLDIVASGDVSISNTNANNNYSGGASIEANAGSITLANSQFSDNGYFDSLTNTLAGFGVDAVAGTSLTLDGVTANNNFTRGASLNAGTDLQVSNSSFDLNNVFATTNIARGYGFDATANGSIVLSNVTADSNYTFGVDLTSNGMIDISDSSFSGNVTSAGLYAMAPGMITLAQVTASNNGYYGASLESNSDVFVKNSAFSNNANPSKYTTGLEVITPGMVSLENVVANQNRDNGIDVYDSTRVELRNVTAIGNGWNGVYADGNCSRVYTFGGTYADNGFTSHPGYGIEVASGLLSLINGPIFSNNYLGDFTYEQGKCFYVPPDEPVNTSLPYGTELPWANLDSLNGKSYFLDCEQYSGTIISLENGDHVVLPCPISDKGSLSRVTQQDLPIILPSEYTYVSGMKVDISNNEIPAAIVDAGIVVSFTAADLRDQNLVILYWTGFEWKELPAFINQNRVVYSSSSDTTYWDGTQWLQLLSVPTDKQFVVSPGQLTQEGFFEAAVNFTGVFVLAEK